MVVSLQNEATIFYYTTPKMNKTTIAILSAIALTACNAPTQQQNEEYIKEEGFIFGTTYHITYKHHKSLQEQMLKKLREYDNSLSTYNPNSTISKINRNEDTELDTLFVNVYNKAREIYELSGQRFDITVRPLSQLWRFTNGHSDTISIATFDSIMSKVDSVKSFIGLNKTSIIDNKLVKADPRITLEAAALAEGYGIDIAASVFEENGVSDYMVELGGELHLKGLNPNGRKWRISIDRPDEGSNEFNHTSQCIISVSNCAVSTSGSYRQFYYTADGHRLQHTINPLTGRPVEHGLLSVTVVGPNTITTDALSTTFMILGPDEAYELAQSLPNIEAYFIFEDKEGNRHETMTEGFKKLLVSPK